jgi:hypothetical protein
MFYFGCALGAIVGYVGAGYFFLAWLINLLGRAEL